MVYWNGDGSVHWGWMVFGMLWMVVFWGAIIWFFAWVIGRATSKDTSVPDRKDAIAIARERYARGEISKEQFEEVRRTLSA